MSACPNEIRDFPLVPVTELALLSPPVTVMQALRLSLDALMTARKMSGVDITRVTGLSSATISKIKSGDRWASAQVLDKLRIALKVTPAELFDPDRAVARLGLSRNQTLSAESPMADIDTPGLPSAFPLEQTGGFPMHHPDPELLSALVAFWDAMTPDGRMELVASARRLKQHPAVGKAHGG